jgi:hypothetical protein
MSKTKTLTVYLLSLSIVFAFMITTIPTLATAETLTPSEPGVSLGKPLSDATLKEFTAMWGGTVTVYSSSSVTNGTGTAISSVYINSAKVLYNDGSGTQPKTFSKTYYFHKK